MDNTQLTFNQRWNSYLAIVLAGAFVLLGITLRNGAPECHPDRSKTWKQVCARSFLAAGW